MSDQKKLVGLNVCESRLNVPIYPIFQTFNPFTLEIKGVRVLKGWNRAGGEEYKEKEE